MDEVHWGTTAMKHFNVRKMVLYRVNIWDLLQGEINENLPKLDRTFPRQTGVNSKLGGTTVSV